MLSSLLQQGFAEVTDPVRMHAELWADSVCKIIACWLPLLMSTVVIGRDLLGSTTQCFPLDLVQVSAQPGNGTVPDSNSSTDSFSGISVYSRQLAEFVNVYCAGQDSSQGDTIFSYQQFAMVLVIQAALMYAPFLFWNITIGRQIICNVRFITRDTEVLYDRFRKQNYQTNLSFIFTKKEARGQPGWEIQGNVQTDALTERQREKLNKPQEELIEAEHKWRDNRTICIWYAAKQAASVVLSAIGLCVYAGVESISVLSIRENFHCSVEDRFSVTCTVPAAKVHKFVWIANMVLLTANLVLTMTHIAVLYARAEEQPFGGIGIKKKKDSTHGASSHGGQVGGIEDAGKDTIRTAQGRQVDGTTQGCCLRLASCLQPGQAGGIEDTARAQEVPLQPRPESGAGTAEEGQATEASPRCCPRLNDSYMMHAFFKANIESVEKYNYVKSRLAIQNSRHDR